MANYWIIFQIFRLIGVFFALFMLQYQLLNVNSIEFRFSLLSALSKYMKLLNFYEENEFKPIWVGGKDPLGKGDLIFKELENT